MERPRVLVAAVGIASSVAGWAACGGSDASVGTSSGGPAPSGTPAASITPGTSGVPGTSGGPPPDTDAGVEDGGGDAGGPDGGGDAGGPGCTVAFRSVATATAAPPGQVAAIVTKPAGVKKGDLLLAFLDVGKNGEAFPPLIAPPEDFTLVAQVDHSADTLTTPKVHLVSRVAIYSKIATGAEPAAYNFTFPGAQDFAASVLAYSGVDTDQPIDAHAERNNPGAGTVYLTPDLTTTGPNEVVVATFGGFMYGTAPLTPTMWSLPVGTKQRAGFNNGDARTMGNFELTADSAGVIDGLSSTTTQSQVAAGTSLLALRPCR